MNKTIDMQVEIECRLCGESTSWAEPHQLRELSVNHPKKKFAFERLCNQCRSVYSPPKWFPKVENDTNNGWSSVQIKSTTCFWCDSQTLFWVGTAEWTDPESVIETVEDVLAGSKESVSWSHGTAEAETRPGSDDPPEVTAVLTRSAPVCHDCVCSHEPDKVFEAIREAAQYYQITDPMWEESYLEKHDTPPEGIPRDEPE